MDAIRTWKDPEYRWLSEDPAEDHPAGLVDLSDDLAPGATGGSFTITATFGPFCGTE